jgi:hypothetical protein
MALVRERYADFGPTLACEKLAECHGVVLANEPAPAAASSSPLSGSDGH